MPRNRRKRTYELTIESLSHEGRGVGRVDGKTVFVDCALPGERVLAERFTKRARFDEARALELLSRSPLRVEPPCAGFERCGGCSLQHLSPALQLEHKERVLIEMLERSGGTRPEEMLPALTGPSVGYRRKARLGVKYVPKKGGVLVGFRERRNSFIAEIERCEVLHPLFGESLRDLAAVIETLSIPDRIPQLEVAMGDDDAALVMRHLAPLTDEDKGALLDFGRRRGIRMYGQSGGEETVRPLAPAAGDDDAPLAYRVDGGAVTIRFAPTDFTQVNADVNRQMVDRVLSLLRLEAGDRVLDLFCGLGNFSLPIARRVREVMGLEGAPSLVTRARRNAALNGLDNVRFDTADLADPETFSGRGLARFEKILVDPPRSGAAALFEHADLAQAELVVYVSCNPATLARDVGEARRRFGFTLTKAGVMDMFPHTAHVESIAVLERG